MKSSLRQPNIVRDQRGSAMLTVIIAMLFIIILGTSLLFAAYSGYMVKITQRADTKNFYTASAALDDIRDGLQQKVGDAVKAAYTDTLAAKPDVGTEDYQTYNAQTVFQKKFYEQVKSIKTDGSNELIAQENKSYQYHPNALISFITDKTSTYTLNDGKNTPGTAELSADGKSFTLKDVRVKCVNAKNYESTVSADITIKLPEFTVGSRASAAIGTTVIVASKGLNKTTGASAVSDGDVYVGGNNASSDIAVSNSGTTLDFSGCTVTCTGDVKVNAGGTLNFTPGTNANSPLWARNITLSGKESKANLGGRISVKNDLTLGGSLDSVKLSGSYYGFGSGSTADDSSAIVVNGKTCSMDLSDLSTLSIAGVSFINATKAANPNTSTSPDTTASLRTGQSVATKPDQLAYLVPVSCLSGCTTNPVVLKNSTTSLTVTLKTTEVLWTTGTGDKTLKSYGITDASQLKIVYPQDTGLAFVFMSFQDQASANAYYADYYKYGSFNGVSAPDYLKQYLTLKGSATTYATAGSAYAGSTVSLVPASAAISAGSEWTAIVNTDYFAEYVDRAKLSQLTQNKEYRFTSGDSIAVVTNNADITANGTEVTGGPYVFDSKTEDYSKIHLIVASGDVTINAPFTGTIICDGTVTIGANVTAALNVDLADAKNGATPLTDYVRAFTASRQASSDAWALNNLVVYENWKKY